MKKFFIAALLISVPAMAKVKVITSIPVLKALVESVGGDLVEVKSIARGNEDPHFVEVRPSFIMAIKDAKLYVSNGMSLDIWAKPLIENSRNDNLKIVDTSKGLHVLGLPTTRVSALLGDVHPEGNPHYWVDPYNVPGMIKQIVSGLVEVDPEHKQAYQDGAKRFLIELKKADGDWQKKLAPFKGTKVVTFHESWDYFAEHFKLEVVAFVEPKPGIPPSGSHTEEVIKLMKREKVPLIIQEPYYPDSTPKLISEKTGAALVKVPQLCGGAPNTDTYIDLMNYVVNSVESALKKVK